MIDHDYDVKGGIRYVKKALEFDEKSPFYLDSLAWGYYKLGRCDEASRLMQRVQKLLGREDAEVQKHIDIIKTCKE